MNCRDTMRDDGRELMARKRKPSTYDVLSTRLKLRATAKCVVSPSEDSCAWEYVQSAWESDKVTRTESRLHVLANPGHEVDVVVRDVARYYLSPELVAELTVLTPSASGNDQPPNPKESKED